MIFFQKTNRNFERGATLVVVTICLAALVAMAALAIDVASLYVAHGEAQRAANAAALAAANMFVRTEITSASNFPLSKVCQTGDTTTATYDAALATLSGNLVGGQPATIQSLQCNLNNLEDPTVTLTLKSATLPTFFSKIWGGSASTVTATATAEAYNQSGSDAPSVVLTSVKPWVIPNCNPNGPPGSCSPNYFINTATGNVSNNSFLGSQINLSRLLSGSSGAGSPVGGVATINFYGLSMVEPPSSACPSCGQTGTPYIDNIACASQVTFSCGQPLGAGTGFPVETISGAGAPTATGARCLIHAIADGPGQGQDQFTTSPPILFTGGDANPALGLRNQDNISRSDSVVTVPLDDGAFPANSKVIGFLQLGILQTSGTAPEVQVTVLNAVGCTPNAIKNFPPTNGITSNSAIPVRLVRNP